MDAQYVINEAEKRGLVRTNIDTRIVLNRMP